MNTENQITISHFSDVLCIWAYLAQIRVDELKTNFGSNIKLEYHFCPIFGSVASMLKKNWENKGGVEALNKHALNIASKFDHIELHPDIWLNNRPTTSINSHLFLKAIQLLEAEGEIESAFPNASATEHLAWQLRLAFFRDCKDISNQQIQMELAEQMGLPADKIKDKISTGHAFAALDSDFQLQSEFQVVGSPTLVFNEGRQKIYGNVGYRVIEANIKELLSQPENQASWC